MDEPPESAYIARDRVLDAIRVGAETRDIEYKSSQPFNAYKWKLVKTCMAMANLRSGGVVIIGMAARNDGGYDRSGVLPDHSPTYDQDVLYALVNRHARPVVSLVVRFVDYDGKRFVGIEVEPFERTPIICGVPTPTEAGGDGVRLGEIVGRSRDRIATSKIGDPDLVSEIIEIAARKRAAEIIAISREIGLSIPSVASQLDREREDFFGGED